VIGANHSLLSNQSTPSELYAAMWAQIASGEPWSGRLINRRRDGSKYLADLTITPVAGPGGQVVNYLGIHRDVTQLYLLESEVAEQKALIESVVDSAPVVIALLDKQERVVLDNHEYKKLMGDLRMAEPATLIIAAVRADLGAAVDRSPREGQYAFADHEIRIDSRGAARWFSCSGIWVQRKDEGADAFFERGNDLYLLLVAKETTRQRAEQEKTRMALLQAMIAEGSRIDALRETLSAAVFKVEGPLNVISSVMGTLVRRGSEEPASSALIAALEAGKAAVDSLRSVIPEHASETLSSVNLNEVMRDVLDLTTTRMLAAGISVHWRPQAVLAAVVAYPNRMRSLFKALVDNAIDSLNTKGWREREIVVATRGDFERVEVIIEDSGAGIPTALRLKVFEPFFSTRKAGGRHLGTGLSSAQQVAADHDGVIEIESADIGGCRVRVVLPVQRRNAMRR